MSSTQATFSCENCGKLYPWKPELAGKKAKCKCGHVLEVPAEAVEPDPLDALDEYGLAPEPVATPVTSARMVPSAAPAGKKAAATPSAGNECPGCGASMVAGAMICLECGYNVKTGKRVATAVAATGTAPGAVKAKGEKPAKGSAKPPTKAGKPTPAGRRRGRGSTEEDDAGAKKKQMVTMVALAVLVIGLIVGARFYFAESDDAVPAASMVGDDAEAARMLREKDPIEAKEFLEANDARNLGNTWTRNVGMMKVDQWYKLGAVKVWAFNALISDHVVIELPTDAAARKPLMDWYNRWLRDHGDEPLASDDGRKYLLLYVMGG